MGLLGLELPAVLILIAIFGAIGVFAKDRLVRSAYTTAVVALVGAALTIIHRPEDTIPAHTRHYLSLNVDNISATRGRWSAARATITHFSPTDSVPMNWTKVRQRVNLYVDTSVRVSLGEKLLIRAYVNPIESSSASYVRLMAARGLSSNVYLTGEANLLSRSSDAAPVVSSLSSMINALAASRIDLLDLDSAAMSLSKAMTIGSRGEMSRSLRDDYASTGTSHLLAVSGLHTGFVFMVLWALFWWAPLVRRGHIYRTFFVVAGLWIFALMALMSASVVRAALMLTVAQLALTFSLRADRYNVLASAAVLMLAINPLWLYDISFQLSFMAVLSILFFLPRFLRLFKTRHKPLKYLWGLFMVGFAAQIGVLPLLAYAFGYVSLSGLLITPILLVPAFIIIAVTLFWIVLPISLLSAPLAWVINTAAKLQNGLVEAAADWSASALTLSLEGGGVAIYYAVIMAVMAAIKYYEYKRQLKGLL